MENIYSSEYCDLYFDYQLRAMKVVWTSKQLRNEVFKSVLQTFAEKAMKYKPKTLFVDARLHIYTVPPDIQKWHDENIIPTYIQSGIKKMAFVTPEFLFSELTTKKIFSQLNAKLSLPTQFFKSESEAQNWLNQ